MERLPVEVWTQVFAYACADGRTGHSLSLLCKDARDISNPYKLAALSIIGAKQLIRANRMLQATPVLLRNVHWLFMAFENPRLSRCEVEADALRDGDNVSVNFSSLSVDSELHINTEHSIKCTRMTRITPTAVEYAVHCILSLLAPGLYTVHMHFTFLTRHTLFLPPLKVCFPSLIDVALYGRFRSPQMPQPKVYPSLRRLRISHPNILHFLCELIASAPRLAHLHILQRSATVADLEKALDLSPPSVVNLNSRGLQT